MDGVTDNDVDADTDADTDADADAETVGLSSISPSVSVLIS